MSTGLTDPYGRLITSLRISVTQRCNFNCFFCHQEGESHPGSELTIEEIVELVSVGAELGIRRVKLTGGEPLLRDDITEIVRRVRPMVQEVSMTTNGYKLESTACSLKEAGLARVNVSLHSGHPDKLCKIIGQDSLEEIKRGILEARRCGLNPVKLNMVVMRSFNETEIDDMIQYAYDVGATLQLIEFQPLEKGEEGWNHYHYDLKPVERELERRSKEIITRDMHRRRQYFLDSGSIVEVVRPMHNSEFCSYCTRLRVTSDGCLKPCLMREDNHVEAVSLLRKGYSRDVVVEAFREAVSRRAPFWRE